ncbi:MAG: isovaleryl-CoA dehydrogenase [Hyphomicrobiaceae bacterium]
MVSRDGFETHEVLNQSPPFADFNLFTSDLALQDAVFREGAGGAAERLTAFGALTGSAQMLAQGRLANEYPPRLKTFDLKGHRIDRVEFHPAYHAMMSMSTAQGLHMASWEHLKNGLDAPETGANVARAAGSYMAAQTEPGHCCPITMTNAAVASLLIEPVLADDLLPRLLVSDYDPSFRPIPEKRAITIGMGMTEKQGGTDVRTNATRAEPVPGEPGVYLLTGHKWFMSAPMSDAFLMLAQAPAGLSCFFVPRLLPDGGVNPIRIQRLKDKLGNRSNASSEVELHGVHGWLIGEEGRGVPAIIEMVTYTRLDCAVSSAGLMRAALAEAIHHCRNRRVFQKQLVDQPLMSAVLADLALEVEAATALAFRLARSFDNPRSELDQAWRRLMTPVTKYWICKIAPAFIYEAMECLGGNGYVEEGRLALLYREAPVNAIWEGSGNVMGLDVLRVLMKEPEVADSILEGLGKAISSDRRLSAQLATVRDLLHKPRDLEVNLRALIEGLAMVAAAALLRVNAPAPVADAFLATRLEGGPRRTYGQGLQRADRNAIIDRSWPH